MKRLTLLLLLPLLASNATHGAVQVEWELVNDTDTAGMYLMVSDGRDLYAGLIESVVGVSRDNGYSWRFADLAPERDGGWVKGIAIDGSTVYAGTYGRGIFRSDNQGITWTPINNGLRTSTTKKGRIIYPLIEQMLVTNSGTVIAVGYHSGTYTSTNRGDTWRDITSEWIRRKATPKLPEWNIGFNVKTVIDFDNYLWAFDSINHIHRSADNGETWEGTADFVHGEASDWLVLDNRLYIAGNHERTPDYGFARWDEAGQMWENLAQGLPPDYFEKNRRPNYRPYTDNPTHIRTLAVNRGRIFAGLNLRGVYLFDSRSERWIPAGLQGHTVSALVSLESNLYALAHITEQDSDNLSTDRNPTRLYRASISFVQSYGKAATTWGAIKRSSDN